MVFIHYPKCSTCKKAKEFLDTNNIKYEERNIVLDNPKYDELKEWITIIPIKKLFNTSGLKYKELKLKDKLDTMSDEEKLKLLASDGMLVKRPLLIDKSKILVGFKIKEWEDNFKI